MKLTLDSIQKPTLKNLILLLFCLAIIFGPAYTLFDTYNYDFKTAPDIKNYLGLADFDFDQSPIRKYRVIVPFLASGINYVFKPVFTRIAPWTFPGPDFSMGMSFLIVNCILTSLFGVLVYKLSKAFGASRFASFIGLLSMLTCRWTSYIAGLPLVDSLYMVIVAMTLLGIKTNNPKMLILAIFIGPWAKESFIFIAPLIFFFSKINKWKQVLLFALSGLLIFTFRYYLDKFSNAPVDLSLKANFATFDAITISLKRLFSFHGVYEVVSISGIWSILIIGLFNKDIRLYLKQKTSLYMVLFLCIVLFHALLSTDLARMFYIGIPVVAIWVSLISDKILLLANSTDNQ